MKIYFAGYQTLMLNRGGPTYKIIHLRKNLEKIGIDVRLFDMWDKNLKIGENDLVHIFNASISTFDLAMNLKSFGAKFVVNPIFFSNHSAKILKIYQTLEKPFHKIFKRTYSDYSLTREICEASAMVLPNTKEEGELLDLGLGINKDKIKIIHNGVEERFLDSDPELFTKKYGIKDFILYVGHLGPVRKNGKNIIKALQKIDHPSVIIADILHNEEGNWCRKEIEKTEKILLIEWLDHDDPLLESAYAACKTFILPTRYETPGRAALEAGLAGANIVITPFGGTREYFLELADYVNPHSVESIKEGIEHSLLKERRSDLKNHILQNFTWEKIAEQTKQMYLEIMK